jgi:hypothetical protein
VTGGAPDLDSGGESREPVPDGGSHIAYVFCAAAFEGVLRVPGLVLHPRLPTPEERSTALTG